MPELWFVAQKGRRFGPLLKEDVAELLRRGSLKPHAFAWRPGMAAWQTIASCVGAEQNVHDDGAVKDLPAPPKARLAAGATFVCFAAIAAAYALLYTYDDYYRFGTLAPFLHAALWVGSVLIAVAAAWLIWRRPRNVFGWGWSLAKVGGVLALLVTLTFSVPLARVSLAVDRIAQARQSFAGYALTYDPATRRIFFDGTIGPDFARRLASILNVNNGAATLVVNSPGGLIDQALEASSVIERHGDLAVQVEGECNSACIALFMAAQRRDADVLASFGFHRPDLVTSVPTFLAEAAREPAQALRAYVVERGFPASRFDELTRSDQMQVLTAIELADIDVVTQLVADGAAVDTAQAKWLWIASASEPAGDGFAELARAFAATDDRTISESAAAIFTALRGNDQDGAKRLVRDLTSTLVPRVLESADPVAAMAYIERSNASIDYLISMQAWSQCADIIDGKGAQPGVVPPSVTASELTALSAAVRSATQSGWIERPLPSWARDAAQALIARTRQQSAESGLDLTRYDSDPRTRCLLTSAMLGNVVHDTPVHGTVSYRWVLSQAE